MTRLPLQFSIQAAVPEDCPALYRLMTDTAFSVQNKDWFFPDSLEFIKTHIKDRGLILKACPDGPEGGAGQAARDSLAAFLLIRFPGPTEDNLGTYLSLSGQEHMQVAHMETVAVAAGFTGYGLQRKLLIEGEKAAAAAGYRHFMATVHPDNHYSLSNFQRLGYKKIAEALKYGGLRRWVLEKSI